MGNAIDVTVGGEKAIRYGADGLYASENVVVSRGEKIYVITGQYIDKDSEIGRDFEPLLSSIRFLRLIKEMTMAESIRTSVQ